MRDRPRPGTVIWQDLTVGDSIALRDFYSQVAGWNWEEFEGDFNMQAPGRAEPVAGICRAQGANARLPPQWLIYIVVRDLDARAGLCRKLGGKVVDGPRPAGSGRICVIQDPAGAVAALFEPAESDPA